MPISDWSSDVCSSDLNDLRCLAAAAPRRKRARLRLRLTDPSVRKPKLFERMTTRDGQPLFLVDRLSPSDDMGSGISAAVAPRHVRRQRGAKGRRTDARLKSEEHTSEVQTLMRISSAGFRLYKKNS